MPILRPLLRYAHSNDETKRRAVNRLRRKSGDSDKTGTVVARKGEKQYNIVNIHSNALKSSELKTVRWQSGRMRRSRKPLNLYGFREFESHPHRHLESNTYRWTRRFGG
jgi:hypothetical protein